MFPNIPGINLRMESIITNAAASPPDIIKSPMLISSIFLLSRTLSSTPSKWPQIKFKDFSFESFLAYSWLNNLPLGLK